MKLTDDEKRALMAEHNNWINLGQLAFAAKGKLDAMLGELQARLLVPPGYSIDYLGDWAVKPIAECAKIAK